MIRRSLPELLARAKTELAANPTITEYQVARRHRRIGDVATRNGTREMRPGLSCMGWLRAPICYLDDYAHRWYPWTFSGERLDRTTEPWLCRLHRRMTERWARKRYPELFEET